MSKSAEVIGVATVDSANAHNEPRTGFINTDLHLTFSEVWKGEASPNFILIKPGGEVGGKKAAIPGHEFDIALGDKIVVFATPSNLGNHVIIGLRQGLYRVGPGDNPALYRVSEYPYGLGRTSSLSLLDLKEQVFKALGKPIESRPAPKSTEPEEKKTELPAPTPSQPPQSGNIASPHAAPAGPESSQRWIGGVVIVMFLAALGGVIIWKRKAQSPG
jgi:hypothetical protein